MKYTLLIPSVLVICFGLALALRAGELEPPAGPVSSTGRFGPRVDILTLGAQGGDEYTITEPGSYYLSGPIDASASGNVAVRVQAPDVTIDLNGYTITGTGTFGIHTGGGSAGGSLTIRNGTLTGFVSGLALSSAGSRVRVEDVTVRDCTGQGINVEVDGIIDRCIASNCGDNGIRVGAGNAVVTNCISTGNANRGITCNGASVVSNCTSMGNGNEDIFAISGLVKGCVASVIVASGGTLVDNEQP